MKLVKGVKLMKKSFQGFSDRPTRRGQDGTSSALPTLPPLKG